MKMIKIKLLIIIVAIFQSTSNIYTQDSVKFSFPDGWRDIKSTKRKIEALQIPIEKLQMLNTTTLLEICLNYPYFIEIFFYSNLQDGFNIVVENFNGLAELINRKDLSSEIFNKYIMIDVIPDNFESLSLIEKGTYAYSLIYLELILSQDTIFNNLSENEKDQIITKCYEVLNKKQAHPKIYGVISYTSCCLLLTKFLNAQSMTFSEEMKQDTNLKDFIERPVIISSDLLSTLKLKTQEYLLSIKN